MGREKRLSEARTRDLTEKTAPPARPAAASASDLPSAPMAAVAVQAQSIPVARMILQLLLLYLLPISLIVLFGKLVLGL